MRHKQERITLLLCLLLGAVSYGTPEVRASDPNFILSVQEGTVTAQVNGVPLNKVMNALQQQTDLTVVVDPTVAKEPVTVHFEGLPLQAGVRTLLEGYRFSLTFRQNNGGGGESAGTQRLRAVYVYPLHIVEGPSFSNKGEPPLVPTTLETRSEELAFIQESLGETSDGNPGFSAWDNLENLSVEELQRLAKETKDPLGKVAVLEELADRPENDEFLSLLGSSLEDANPLVRESSLELLGEMETVPVDLVEKAAMYDADPNLRLAALELLGESEAKSFPIDSFGKVALHDTDAEVRLAALDILEEHVAFEKIDVLTMTKIREVLKQSLQDPVAEIREEAADLLEEL